MSNLITTAQNIVDKTTALQEEKVNLRNLLNGLKDLIIDVRSKFDKVSVVDNAKRFEANFYMDNDLYKIEIKNLNYYLYINGNTPDPEVNFTLVSYIEKLESFITNKIGEMRKDLDELEQKLK